MRIPVTIASLLLTSACTAVNEAAPVPVQAVPPVAVAAAPASGPTAAPTPLVTPGMQWLYGAGEGAAASIQTYHALRDHVLAAIAKRPRDSVVLAEGASLEAPSFVPCGRKPFAVVLDADETAIQNLGYEYALAKSGKATDAAALSRWQSKARTEVRPMPGAVTALNAIRAHEVTVIFNSNRNNRDTAATAETLVYAGLGPAVPLHTLYLRGDVDGQSGKDGRRTHIAQHYCVVAMAGDQLGDFADAFNRRGLPIQGRRRLAGTGPIAALWGNGWFMLANPVYGPGLRGSLDEVYPPEVRWDDPGASDR